MVHGKRSGGSCGLLLGGGGGGNRQSPVPLCTCMHVGDMTNSYVADSSNPYIIYSIYFTVQCVGCER